MAEKRLGKIARHYDAQYVWIPEDADKFDDRIRRTENHWLWTGYVDASDGYGRFKPRHNERAQLAHRVAYVGGSGQSLTTSPSSTTWAIPGISAAACGPSAWRPSPMRRTSDAATHRRGKMRVKHTAQNAAASTTSRTQSTAQAESGAAGYAVARIMPGSAPLRRRGQGRQARAWCAGTGHSDQRLGLARLPHMGIDPGLS